MKVRSVRVRMLVLVEGLKKGGTLERKGGRVYRLDTRCQCLLVPCILLYVIVLLAFLPRVAMWHGWTPFPPSPCPCTTCLPYVRPTSQRRGWQANNIGHAPRSFDQNRLKVARSLSPCGPLLAVLLLQYTHGAPIPYRAGKSGWVGQRANEQQREQGKGRAPLTHTSAERASRPPTPEFNTAEVPPCPRSSTLDAGRLFRVIPGRGKERRT
ncbi:hypothetical protein V8E36_007164 [Tilletia maclaganii]